MLARVINLRIPAEAHSLCTPCTSPAAARWCRSPAMTCRCNTQPACSGNICIPEHRPPACSTSRIWARSRCGRNPAGSRMPRWRWSGWCRRTSWRRAGPAALRPVHQCRRRHSRRPDGGEFRQPSVSGGQRRLQGRGRGASARPSVGRLRDRAAGRSRADRAAGAEGRIGAGEVCAVRPAMRFMDAGPHRVAGIDCFVSRSGYTGEDGFEISVPAEHAEALAAAQFAGRSATCCRSGLARATACGSRPGFASTATTSTPRRRRSRARWNGRSKRAAARRRARRRFCRRGQDSAQFENGAPRRRVGLKPEGRAPVREGACVIRRRNLIRTDRHASPRAASAPASMRRSRWAICRRRTRRPGIRVCRTARTAPAAAGSADALCSQHL
jgi:hypothetical protein